MSRTRLGASVAFGALMLLGVGVAFWVVVASYSPVPFADFWGQIPFLDRAVDGDVRIGDLWAQSNEHRIFVPRLAFALEYAFFGGRYVFLLAVIIVSLFALAALLATAVWRETRDRLLTWASFCVASIALFSPAAEENLTWPFQVGFVQVFLFAAISIFALVTATAARARHRHAWSAAAAVAAVAATYSLANGLLVWLVLLLLALTLRLGVRSTTILMLVAAATTFSYAWHFEPVSQHAAYGESITQPIAMAKYATVYLGSALRPSGVYAAGFVGVLGILLLAVLGTFAWRSRASGSLTTAFGFGLAVFVLLTALETALGRVDLGLTQALSPRYATASAVFWLGLVLGFLTPTVERVHLAVSVGGIQRRIGTTPYFAVVMVVAVVISLSAIPDRVSVKQPVIGKELVVLAYRAGVDDPARTESGSPSPQLVKSGLTWLRMKRLGPWASGGMVDDARFTLPQDGAPATNCRGRIEKRTEVRGGSRLEGWIASPGGETESDQLAVLGTQGNQGGIGLVGTYRPDVQDAGGVTTDWSGLVAYVRGHPATPLRIILVAGDHRSALCELAVSSSA